MYQTVQVASLKDTIAKKDEEIEELQLLKDPNSRSPNASNSLRHSSSFSGITSISGQRGQRLTVGRVARFSEKAASDSENCSEFSDRHSENSSQQSADDLKHQRENFGSAHADSEERLSDISDGGISIGAETDSSTVESNFLGVRKPSETIKEKM